MASDKSSGERSANGPVSSGESLGLPEDTAAGLAGRNQNFSKGASHLAGRDGSAAKGVGGGGGFDAAQCPAYRQTLALRGCAVYSRNYSSPATEQLAERLLASTVLPEGVAREDVAVVELQITPEGPAASGAFQKLLGDNHIAFAEAAYSNDWFAYSPAGGAGQDISIALVTTQPKIVLYKTASLKTAPFETAQFKTVWCKANPLRKKMQSSMSGLIGKSQSWPRSGRRNQVPRPRRTRLWQYTGQ